MQGITFVSDVSGDKVEALAGGPVLQEEVIPARQQERPSGKALLRTTHRLISVLQQVRAFLCYVTSFYRFSPVFAAHYHRRQHSS
jgi:hypothetical protein